MPIIPGKKGQEAMVGAFVDEAPGISRNSVAPVVSAATSKMALERNYSGVARTVKITNRAERGYVKAFCGAFDGEAFPEGASEDNTTWLQPGESMTVPKDAAIHFCGNVWDPMAADGDDIIRRYGDWQYESILGSGRGVTVRKIGAPMQLPDLLVVQVDQRGRELHEPIAVYDKYTKSARYVPRLVKEESQWEKDSNAEIVRENSVDTYLEAAS